MVAPCLILFLAFEPTLSWPSMRTKSVGLAAARSRTFGQHLIAAKALAGYGHWLPWLKQELGWASESSALRFMHIAELAKSFRLTDLDIDYSSLSPSRALHAVRGR